MQVKRDPLALQRRRVGSDPVQHVDAVDGMQFLRRDPREKQRIESIEAAGARCDEHTALAAPEDQRRADIRARFEQLAQVLQAGTFMGHPAASAAGMRQRRGGGAQPPASRTDVEQDMVAQCRQHGTRQGGVDGLRWRYHRAALAHRADLEQAAVVILHHGEAGARPEVVADVFERGGHGAVDAKARVRHLVQVAQQRFAARRLNVPFAQLGDRAAKRQQQRGPQVQARFRHGMRVGDRGGAVQHHGHDGDARALLQSVAQRCDHDGEKHEHQREDIGLAAGGDHGTAHGGIDAVHQLSARPGVLEPRADISERARRGIGGQDEQRRFVRPARPDHVGDCDEQCRQRQHQPDAGNQFVVGLVRMRRRGRCILVQRGA